MFARHELELRGELGLLDRIDANGRSRVADQEPLLIDRELVAACLGPLVQRKARQTLVIGLAGRLDAVARDTSMIYSRG